MGTILTTECENCRYGTINEIDKAHIKVYCAYKEKTYNYGQRIPCEFKEKRKEETDVKYNG